MKRLSALALARTCDHTIDTSQPTTVHARQDLFNQARPGQDSVAASLSIVWTLIPSSDEDLQKTGRIPIAVLQPPPLLYLTIISSLVTYFP